MQRRTPSEQRPSRVAGRAVGSLLAVGLWLALWQSAAALRFGGRPLLATPWQTVSALPRSAGQLGADLLTTLARAGVGLALGVGVGVAIGLLAAAVVRRAPLLEGLLDFARSVPPVVLLPLFLLALGFGEVARVATVAAGCVWTMALVVTTAARALRSGRRELLDLAGATRLQAIAWTQPWESLGALVVGLRTAASTAVVVAVVTEMIAGADHGVGSRVVMAEVAGDTVELTLDIVAIGVAGWLINRALRGLEDQVNVHLT